MVAFEVEGITKVQSQYKRIVPLVGNYYRKFRKLLGRLIETISSETQKWERSTTIIGTSLIGRWDSLNSLATVRVS